MLGPKIGKNRETIWVFERGHCKPIGKNRETISEKFFLGKIGKPFWRSFFDFFFGKNRETILVFKSGHCKQIGKDRETIWGKFFQKFVREIPGNDLNFGPISRGKNRETKRGTPI